MVEVVIDYLQNKDELGRLAPKIIYTGPIDEYFAYSLGALEYRSVRFETELLDIPNFQSNAVVNYTDVKIPWTRIIEHKWFEFGKDDDSRIYPIPLSAENTVQNGNQETSLSIPLMMIKTARC